MSGEISFTYNNIREVLSYVPVTGTDWLMTCLIRENVISEQIGSVSGGIFTRSLILSVLTAAVLIGLFAFILLQNRKNARLALEKETAEAEKPAPGPELKGRRILLAEDIAVNAEKS